MLEEVEKFLNELLQQDHDKQFLLLNKQETEFLKKLLFAVSLHQEFALRQCSYGGDVREFLYILVERTYTWAAITTILRTRGAYGRVKEE